MKGFLIGLGLVYVAGAVFTRLHLDTGPESDGRLTVLWPYYLARHPHEFSRAIGNALKTPGS